MHAILGWTTQRMIEKLNFGFCEDCEPYYDGEFSVDIENKEYRETRFSTDPYIRQNETREPKNMAIGYMDRGYLPKSADNSPAPEAMVLIDRI